MAFRPGMWWICKKLTFFKQDVSFTANANSDMEDTFVVVDDLRSISAKTDTNPAGVQPAGGQTVAATLKGPQLARTTVFGVFDGHGGSEVAEEAAKVFPEVFRQTLQGRIHDCERSVVGKRFLFLC